MPHIPSCSTTEIEVLKFEDALKKSLLPCDEYDINKWLYVPNFYSEYRYILGTKGENPLVCIGINPSTAKPDALDRTLQSVERVAHANGFDSFIMFNVYAQRATSPDDMELILNHELHAQNMKAFEYILSLSKHSPKVWAAWGAIIEKRDYLSSCVMDMVKIGTQYGAEWYTAGKRSVKGHPHHPLYLKSDTVLDEFSDISEYLNKTYFKR